MLCRWHQRVFSELVLASDNAKAPETEPCGRCPAISETQPREGKCLAQGYTAAEPGPRPRSSDGSPSSGPRRGVAGAGPVDSALSWAGRVDTAWLRSWMGRPRMGGEGRRASAVATSRSDGAVVEQDAESSSALGEPLSHSQSPQRQAWFPQDHLCLLLAAPSTHAAPNFHLYRWPLGWADGERRLLS